MNRTVIGTLIAQPCVLKHQARPWKTVRRPIGFFDGWRRNFRIVDGSRWPYLLPMQTLAEPEMKCEGGARRCRRTWSWRGSARKGAISALGFGTLAIGLALTVTPVPSALVILLGLAVLAREYAWARRLIGPCRELARRLMTPVRRLIARRALVGAGSR